MNSFKLNQTLENSLYPIEKEVYKLRKTTEKTIYSVVCSIISVFFSGIGTTLMFQEGYIPKLIDQIVCNKNENIFRNIQNETLLTTSLNVIALLLTFVVISAIGLFLIKVVYRDKTPAKLKKTDKGINELVENFHKLTINNIVIGLSLVDKADDDSYNENVKLLYLYEALYYFKVSVCEFEKAKVFEEYGNVYNMDLINSIGHSTMYTTFQVFKNGLEKLDTQLNKYDKNEFTKASVENEEDKQGDILTEKKILNEISGKLNRYNRLLEKYKSKSDEEYIF